MGSAKNKNDPKLAEASHEIAWITVLEHIRRKLKKRA
jgi:hypothetical protein